MLKQIYYRTGLCVLFFLLHLLTEGCVATCLGQHLWILHKPSLLLCYGTEKLIQLY